MIENKKTGQRYIGQSIHIYQRWHQHINRPQMSMRVDRAIKKHGADNFDLKVICELEQDDGLLNEMEKYYVWKYNTYKNDFHYNLTPGGDFNPMKVPDIAAKKSKAMSGENHPLYGKKRTPETKAKISKAHFGKKLSQKTREKMSKAKSGENNPMFGEKHSEEARKKMSKAQSGENHPMYNKKHSEDAMRKISRAQNTTGFFRVSKSKAPTCKQRFIYKYLYYENGKQRSIYSVDIKKLERKVKAKGLEWFKLDDNNGE